MFFEKNLSSSSGSGPGSCISRRILCSAKLNGRRIERRDECNSILSRNCALMLTLASCVLLSALSGCGSNYTVTAAGIGSFQASSDAVEFGNVQVGKIGNSTLTLINQGTAAVSVSDLKITGNQFAVASPNSLPITVAANSTMSVDVQFKPKASGDSTGQLTISSSSKKSPSLRVRLHGNGAAAASTSTPTLNSLSCSQNSVTGSGSDSCTANLSEAAGSSGLTVTLSSSNSAVTVPASVTVPSGATSAGFTATVAAVTTAQTATLTASAGGATQTFGISLGAVASEQNAPGLKMSTASLNFGGVTKNTKSAPLSVMLTSSGTAPLTINSAVPSGAGFTVSGTAFPATLNPGQTASLTVVFDPTVMGISTGAISISDNASPSTAAISLSGTGMAGAGTLSGLSCSQNSITGSGSDTCTVTLTAAAGSSGVAVSLSSSNNAVSVPGAVTVPAGSSSIGFTATVSAVTTAQTDTLTASSGGVAENYSINLGAAGPSLTVGTSSVAFGTVDLNTPATQSVTLTSSGTAPVTITGGNATGSPFSISGMSFPATLNPGQVATLYVQFDPTTAGTASGTVTLTSNASPSTATIALSGTGGSASYEVQLTWVAPTNSTDPVAGYNVYRATGSGSSYQLLNSSVNLPTTYTDSSVQNGTSYTYYIESVDADGNQSTPSNTFSASIP